MKPDPFERFNEVIPKYLYEVFKKEFQDAIRFKDEQDKPEDRAVMSADP